VISELARQSLQRPAGDVRVSFDAAVPLSAVRGALKKHLLAL
jgi:hypothetical protein